MSELLSDIFRLVRLAVSAYSLYLVLALAVCGTLWSLMVVATAIRLVIRFFRSA